MAKTKINLSRCLCVTWYARQRRCANLVQLCRGDGFYRWWLQQRYDLSDMWQHGYPTTQDSSPPGRLHSLSLPELGRHRCEQKSYSTVSLCHSCVCKWNLHSCSSIEINVLKTARDIGITSARHLNYSEQGRHDFDWKEYAAREELIR